MMLKHSVSVCTLPHSDATVADTTANRHRARRTAMCGVIDCCQVRLGPARSSHQPLQMSAAWAARFPVHRAACNVSAEALEDLLAIEGVALNELVRVKSGWGNVPCIHQQGRLGQDAGEGVMWVFYVRVSACDCVHGLQYFVRVVFAL